MIGNQESNFKNRVGIDERGMVALFTAVIICILLTIVVTSMVGLMVGEQRQSTDADQSVRAYYAAEAGVEDGLKQVKDYLAGGVVPAGGCATAPLGPSVSYSCKQVSITSNRLSGSRNVEEVEQIEPGSSSNYRRVVISWHLYGTDPDVVPTGYVGPPGANFTQRGAWAYPAVMELTVLSYNPSGSITPAAPTSPTGIKIQTMALRPAAGAPTSANFNNGAIGNKQENAGCSPANITLTGGYNCQISLELAQANSSNAYIFRLRPRYAGTHYQVQFFNGLGGGPPIVVDDQNATIDVTARAGDVYRRVQARVPIKAGVASGLDFVLFSDTDICKDFVVINGAATPQSCALP